MCDYLQKEVKDYSTFISGKENRIGVCSHNYNCPDYSTISRGLNYEGKCLNEACSLYEKRQVIKKGYGKFDFLIDKDKCYCYYCVRPIAITELCFLKVLMPLLLLDSRTIHAIAYLKQVLYQKIHSFLMSQTNIKNISDSR